MQEVFPPEEVLAFDLWKEPLADPGIRVFVAVHEGEDLLAWAGENGKQLYGIFAEIYDPYQVEDHEFTNRRPGMK